MVQPLHIKGAHIWEEHIRDGWIISNHDLYTTDHIVEKPAAGAMAVDLEGYTIFPALVNAHDHLELNHYPRSKFREVYGNAHQWGEDMNARLDSEPYKSLRAYPLWDKLFIGGLKNLLCGATTVIHHNPPHRELWRKDFPVRVLRKYGWAHSLHFNTDEEVVTSYRSTPSDVPWFIHLAEGTDEVAAGEYQRLKALGCVGPNTVFVHGVGLTAEDVVDAHTSAVGFSHLWHGSEIPIIWCPTTNLYLLGKTGHPRMGWNTHNLLGSDSRLTAEGDLLDELRFAATWYKKNQDGDNLAIYLATQTTYRWASYWKENILPIRSEDCADFIVISAIDDAAHKLCNSRRADLAMVVYDGIPRIGNPDIMAKFPHIQTVPARLDGVEKAIHIDLARQIHRCKLQEPGLEVAPLPTGRRWWL